MYSLQNLFVVPTIRLPRIPGTHAAAINTICYLLFFCPSQPVLKSNNVILWVGLGEMMMCLASASVLDILLYMSRQRVKLMLLLLIPGFDLDSGWRKKSLLPRDGKVPRSTSEERRERERCYRWLLTAFSTIIEDFFYIQTTDKTGKDHACSLLTSSPLYKSSI